MQDEDAEEELGEHGRWAGHEYTQKMAKQARAALQKQRETLIMLCSGSSDAAVRQCYGEYKMAEVLVKLFNGGKP